MALSESGLVAKGVYPGPMIYGPQGKRITVRPKKGPARGSRPGKRSLFVAPKPKRGRGRGR